MKELPCSTGLTERIRVTTLQDCAEVFQMFNGQLINTLIPALIKTDNHHVWWEHVSGESTVRRCLDNVFYDACFCYFVLSCVVHARPQPCIPYLNRTSRWQRVWHVQCLVVCYQNDMWKGNSRRCVRKLLLLKMFFFHKTHQCSKSCVQHSSPNCVKYWITNAITQLSAMFNLNCKF